MTGSNTTSLAPESSPALLLEPDACTEVVVHPLVILAILDHHTRRQEPEGRVIGTLLGRRDGSKIEITNCFAVPHAERGEEVAIGKDFNKQMLGLHVRNQKDEAVVGWYASASPNLPLIADTSSLIHEFYASESEDGDPIHLVADTTLLTDTLTVQAFQSSPVQLQGEPLGILFHEVQLRMLSSEAESICLGELGKQEATSSTNNSADTSALQLSMEKLRDFLEQASTYVDDVVDGKTPVSDDVTLVGRQLADALAVIPRIRPAVFDQIFDDSLQDLLMVTYLSNITKTQLAVAEKLNATLGKTPATES